MTVHELKQLCLSLEKAGYKNSNLYVLDEDAFYEQKEIVLTPNEYGDIVLSSKW